MNQPDGVIEMPPAQRETGVTRLQRFLDVTLKIFLEIKINNVAARGHDIAHNPVAKVERVDQQLLPERSYFMCPGTFTEDQSQFFLTVRQLGAGGRLHPEQTMKN